MKSKWLFKTAVAEHNITFSSIADYLSKLCAEMALYSAIAKTLITCKM